MLLADKVCTCLNGSRANDLINVTSVKTVTVMDANSHVDSIFYIFHNILISI